MELRNVEKQEKSITALTIAVSAAELEAGKQEAYKKNRNKISIPGFRKGKAPRQIIERMYGEGVFFEDAINICYPKAYEEALAESGIKPVGVADIEMSEMPEDGGFVFIAKVPTEPEVTLGEYKGVEAEKDEVKVLAADVKAELERMAQRTARTETVSRAAKNGDTVVLDFEGFVDGEAFEGGKAEKHELVLGSGSFIPGFEEQLVGAKAEDELEVSVSFPEEYHAAELAGKPAVFKCKVHSVQQTVLPKMDDEFAKDVSETCETLDELKKEIKDKLTESRKQQVDHDFEERVLDKVLENMQADIPEAMYESQLDSIVQDFGYRVQMQGMGLEQYVAMNGMDMASFRKLFRDQAERQVKVRLALQKVAELENIEIDDETLEAEYTKMAESYGMEAEQIKGAIAPDAVKGDLRVTRALELVKDKAKAKKKAAAKKKKTEVESAEEIVAAEE